ncbi:serine hydrolase [Paraburkholderia sp. Se-20369]|nr:serine hydrolase [Paraburkholderia sp. Se-20369]
MARRVTADSLARLAAISREMGTTALVVLEGDEVTLEAGQVERPIELMSITKSIVSLVIGQLVDRGLLSLNQRVAEFIPAWKGTPKEAIRISHVLSHTTGLHDQRRTDEIYAAGDFVEFAMSAELDHAPGRHFFYSNRASNLLAPIVESVSGERLDTWAHEHLFTPLGIDDWAWSEDRAGNVQVMAGLQMSARSLARIGQLVLGRGRWGNVQVVSEAWIEASTETYQQHAGSVTGLFWWIDPGVCEIGFSRALFDEWRASGVPEDFIARFAHLEGRYFQVRPGQDNEFLQEVQDVIVGRRRKVSDRLLRPYYDMTWRAGRNDADVRYNHPPRSVFADGWGGQLLWVAPAQQLVVARLREVTTLTDTRDFGSFRPALDAHLLGIAPGQVRDSFVRRLVSRLARSAVGRLRRNRHQD